MTPAEQAAVAAFPELQRLIDLRNAGWTFLTPFVANDHIEQVQAYRPWPDGHVDVIRLRSSTDAAAMRTDGRQPVGILWQKDGGLSDLVDELLSLPVPGTRAAPRLIRGIGPTLWTP